MKITDYPQVAKVQNDDVFLIDGTRGTKTIPVSRMPYDLFDGIPEMHNQIFRGKNLGSIYTNTQKNAVLTGSFTDLWLGDYWEIGGVRYRIADFNYFMGTGESRVTANHVVIVPDQYIGGLAQYHNAEESPGYFNASIRSTLSSRAASIIFAFSDANILTIPHTLLTGVTNTGGIELTRTSSKFELMTLHHVYGTPNYNARNAPQPTNQFSLFRVAPRYIILDESSGYYLQDLTTTRRPHLVSTSGSVFSSSTSKNTEGLRPFFALRG